MGVKALTRESPASDPQRELVYKMENEAIGARTYMRLTKPTLERYLRDIVKAFGMPPVVIRYADLGRWAAEWCEPNIITFGSKRASRDLLTAAHEIAHHLHSWLCEGLEQEAHGAQFMTCYMCVLDASRIVPIVGMEAVCRSYGVAYKRVADGCDTDKLRKVVRGRRGSGS